MGAGGSELEARLVDAEGAERIEFLLQLAWALRRTDPERSVALATEARTRIAEHGAPASAACEALGVMSCAERHRRNMQASEAYAREALALLDDDVGPDVRVLAHYALGSALLGRGLEEARSVLHAGLPGEDGPRARTELMALLLRTLGKAEYRTGDVERSEAHLKEAERLAREAGDPLLLGRVLWVCGEIELASGRAAQGERRTAEALELARQSGDSLLEGNCLRQLGSAASRRRAHGEALAFLEEAAELERAGEHGVGLANALNLLTLEYLAMGLPEKAAEIAEEAVGLWRDLENSAGLGAALHYQAHAYGDLEEPARALSLSQEAVATIRSSGVRPDLASLLDGLARHSMKAGDLDGAEAAFAEQVSIAEAMGKPDVHALGLGGLAGILGERGDAAGAREHMERALAIAEVSGEQETISNVCGDAATLYEALGDFGQALAHYRRHAEIQRAGVESVARARESAERRRVASELRFTKAFRASPDAVSITRLSDGTILEVNEGFETMSGIRARDAIGQTTVELGLWDDPDLREQFAQQLRDAGRVRGLQVSGQRSSKERAWLEVSAELIELDGEAAVLTVARDVTERVLAERRLAESEARYRELIEQQPNTVILYDLRDRRILDCNAAGERLLGRPRSEIIGAHPESMAADFLPDGMRPVDAARAIDRRMLEERVEQTFEWTWRRPDGTEVITELRLVPFGPPEGHQALASIVDRTESIRAERALADSEERYRSVVEDQTEFIVRHEPGGILTFVNDAYCRYFGLEAEELLGASFYELIPDEEFRALVRRKLASLTPEQPFATKEHIVTAADGSRRWNEWTDRAFFDDEGRVLRLQSVGRDTTDRKEAEAALHAALEEVKRLRDRLQEENIYLREEIREAYDAKDIVGSSAAMQELQKAIRTVARTDATVLIQGETGTGKELVVRALHEASPRRRRPLIKVNCAAVAAGLVESELFGHERGAFTGAVQQRKGRFELADGGSIFLDEVGELSADVQAKLLRVLEESEFERVGSSTVIKTNVRILAATNRDLEEEVRAGRFRSDLFYRLNVFPIEVPALRRRGADILELAQHFLRVFAQRFAKALHGFDVETTRWLESHTWPGNVRELRNLIERAAIASTGPDLTLRDLGRRDAGDRAGSPADATLDAIQRAHIVRILERTGWVIQGEGGAARILGMPAGTLRSRMAKLGIRKP